MMGGVVLAHQSAQRVVAVPHGAAVATRRQRNVEVADRVPGVPPDAPYITGGAAFAGLKTETPLGSNSDSAIGWTAGAGVEWAFTRAWSAKLEYLYADLGSNTCDAATCGVSTTIDPKVNIVRAGINYRF